MPGRAGPSAGSCPQESGRVLLLVEAVAFGQQPGAPLLTPTHKKRRAELELRYAQPLQELLAGHVAKTDRGAAPLQLTATA